MFQLTPQQYQVIDALSHGATMTEAADQAGIHRNTIGNWRASDDFREALASAHYDRAALYRDRAVELADLAFEAIRKVLTDPKSSPSVLLRAATLIIEKVTTPPQFREEKPADITGMLAAMDAADRMHLAQQREQPFEPPSDAQECTTAPNDAQANPVFQRPNSAQPEEPSGRNYKHCCHNKPLAASA